MPTRDDNDMDATRASRISKPLLALLVRSFSSTSRPALRAAACGGRPRAGNDTTATGEPASPSTPRLLSYAGFATAHQQVSAPGAAWDPPVRRSMVGP